MLNVTLIDTGNSRHEINEPIGIENLAGECRRHFSSDVNIKLLSYQFVDHDLVCTAAAASDVVGISVQLGSLERVCQILDTLTSLGRAPLIVLGSVVPTFAAKHFLARYPDVICVIGEGEEAFVDILRHSLAQQKCTASGTKSILVNSNTPNISFLHHGDYVFTKRRLVSLVNLAPPARDLLKDTIESKGIVRIEGSRGCPWGYCSFCSVPRRYGDTEWRAFPTDRIISELAIISELGSHRPYFTDEDFFGRDYGRASELAMSIRNAKQDGIIQPQLQFVAATSVDSLTRLGRDGDLRDLLKGFKAAGLAEVFLGLESGCSAQLRRYRKGISPRQIHRTVRQVKDLDIKIDVGFIMFDPEMSLEDVRQNLAFIQSANLEFADARLTKALRVMPDTPLMSRLARLNLLEGPLNVDQLTYNFRFAAPEIQLIFDTFSSWESETSDKIYDIQARMRGEVISESIREKDRNTLGQLRNLDLRFLEACVGIVQTQQAKDPASLRLQLENAFEFNNCRQLIIAEAMTRT